MATAKRRAFHEMDHDHELLREEIVYANRTELRGPIPEFLAKKRAEQAPETAAGYEVVFGVSSDSVKNTVSRQSGRSSRALPTISSRPSANGVCRPAPFMTACAGSRPG